MKAVRKDGLRDGTMIDRIIAAKIGAIVMRAGLSRSFEQHAEPIVLPGESISKYQPHGSQSSAAATQTPVKTESAPRPRPSTEYSIDPSAFAAGSMVLPGETLAKYGKDKQQSRGKSEAQPESWH